MLADSSSIDDRRRVSWTARLIPVLLAMAALPTVVTIAQQRPGRQRQADTTRSKEAEQAAPRLRQLPIYYVVRPMDLAVVEAQSEKAPAGVPIRCEVRTPPGGESGVQILYLAANGASVKKGDLLIEFDSSPIQQALDSATFALERARAEQLVATARFENQKTRNETAMADAELRVQIAELEVRSFEGAFSGKLKSLEASFQAAQRNAKRVQSRQEKGQASDSELEQAQLQLAAAKAELDQLKEYEYKKQALRTVGELEVAKRNLLQLTRDGELQLEEAEAAKTVADRALAMERTRYEVLAKQRDKCKVYAPDDGVVVRHALAREGAFVRERQLILTLQPRSVAVGPSRPRSQRVIKNVLAIPKSAVVQQGRRDCCLVLTDQGIEQRPIVVGASDGSNVEVRTGLTADDRVLLYPDQALPPAP